jgi:hypothetical protein
MIRLQKCSRWMGNAHVYRFKLYYKIGETSNIHNRAQVLWTITLAPIKSRFLWNYHDFPHLVPSIFLSHNLNNLNNFIESIYAQT